MHVYLPFRFLPLACLAFASAAAMDARAQPFGGADTSKRGGVNGVVLAWPVLDYVNLTAAIGTSRARTELGRTATPLDNITGILTSGQYLDGRNREPYYAIGVDYFLVPALALSVEYQRTHLPVPGLDAVNSASIGLTVRWR
jgi:hypothetical protein